MSRRPNRPRLEYQDVLMEISSGSSRVAAILSGSLTNELLTVAIRYNFIDLNKKEEQSLFEGNGVLSTFSSQIKIGYAMGLYGRKLRHDLDVIRDIRNDFAHSLDRVVLSDDDFKNRLIGLHSVSDLKDRKTKDVNFILVHAVQKICLFLIMRTAPTNIYASDESIKELEPLDFSNFYECKRRDHVKGS